MTGLETKLRQIAKRNLAANGSLPVLRRGCPEWDVWRAWRFRHGLPCAFMDTMEKWTVPTELPPENLDEALKTAGAGPLSERLKG